MTCGPGSKQLSTKINRTVVAGRPNRLPSPEQTPAIQRSRGRTRVEAIAVSLPSYGAVPTQHGGPRKREDDRNLAGLDPSSAAAVDTWARYVSGWTGWNHVRAAAALAAAVAFTGARGG